MNYKEALSYLDSFFNLEKVPRYNYSRELKLERMQNLLQAFGNPQKDFKAVHIAGSKGKGSVAVSLYQILKENGLRCGLYTSPHLLSLRERIRYSQNNSRDPLNFGDTISEQELIELVEEVRPGLEKFSQDSGWGRPTFFEVYTLLAFLYFARQRVELAVIETGLGGRLDATNLLSPLLTAISKILFEHTDKLGKTIPEIAREKAGILKPGIPCILGFQKWPQASALIKKRAEELGIRLLALGEDIQLRAENDSFSLQIAGSSYQDLRTNLVGKFQFENLALSLSLAHLLRELGYDLREEKIKQALLNIYWPGRFQIIQRTPLTILDAGHTPESIQLIGQEIKHLFPEKRVLSIVGMSRDKEKEKILKEIFSFSDKIILTQADNPRATSVEELAEIVKSEISQHKDYLLAQGLPQTLSLLPAEEEEQIVLITGSVFLIAEYLNSFPAEALRTQNHLI